MGRKLIVGCGYLGMRVAQRWREQGEEVFAVTRSSSRAEQWQRADLQPIVADVTNPDSLRDLPQVETVLLAVGYDRSAGKSLGDVYVQGLSHVLDALPVETGRVIYISSTGVYGACEGDWVDESTECRPLREGGRACLEAEQLLQQHRLGNQSVILRLAGIYGPARIPRVASLQAGEPIDAPAAGYLNLIHVDDAADIVLAVERQVTPPALYVVADGQPTQRREYYAELARLVKAPPPQFVPPDPQSPAGQRAAADKRINSARLIRELGLRLRYPTFREGLAAIIDGE